MVYHTLEPMSRCSFQAKSKQKKFSRDSQLHTLNFVVTLSFWDSAPPALNRGPVMFFSDRVNMFDANIWGSWQEHEERSWMESKCSKSLFFSRNPVVSYVTWGLKKKNESLLAAQQLSGKWTWQNCCLQNLKKGKKKKERKKKNSLTLLRLNDQAITLFI